MRPDHIPNEAGYVPFCPCSLCVAAMARECGLEKAGPRGLPESTWTYDYETVTVCAAREGEPRYVNTHFGTQREAWQKLIVEIEAGLSLGASARKRAVAELERITKDLADDAERLVIAKQRLAWIEESSGKDT